MSKTFCLDRNFRDDPNKLLNILAKIKKNRFKNLAHPFLVNAEEWRYQKYNYNGLFHKGLQHNLIDGRLVNNQDYEKIRNAIVENDQILLKDVPMALNSTIKLVNPLASLCTLILGAPQAALKLDSCPSLSSSWAAAEMVELYAHVVARDVPFNEYEINPIIAKLLDTKYLNNTEVLSNLKYSPANTSKPFNPKTIFRGNLYGDETGPYISQLLFLEIRAGALRTKQLYTVPPTRIQAWLEKFRVEWGINLTETIQMQNGNLSLLPAATPGNKLENRYVYSGRSLAEIVHLDPAYQFFYQSSIILSTLGANMNGDWPTYSNQTNFATSNGIPSVQCLLADVTNYALKHSWYWKWQNNRRLRPETFGLWIHDIKAGLIPNEKNFDISDVILNNKILDEIFEINNGWLNTANSYTLAQAYREGAPCHPSYVSGHAIIAGACATILQRGQF